jgi:FixJ family two-component response regulator
VNPCLGDDNSLALRLFGDLVLGVSLLFQGPGRVPNRPLPAPLIHVVDDDADFQVAVSRLLRAAGYQVRCFSSAGEFFVASFDDGPGCILLDVHMPGPSGLDMQDALARMAWKQPIIFMSGISDIPTTVRAIQGGALDFLVKPVPKDTLLGAIEHALARGAEQRVDRERIGIWRSRLDTLSPREREVLERVVSGKLNKVIGAELGAAERTVKTHRARVMEKMGAASLAELVQMTDHLRAAGIMQTASTTPR